MTAPRLPGQTLSNPAGGGPPSPPLAPLGWIRVSAPRLAARAASRRRGSSRNRSSPSNPPGRIPVSTARSARVDPGLRSAPGGAGRVAAAGLFARALIAVYSRRGESLSPPLGWIRVSAPRLTARAASRRRGSSRKRSSRLSNFRRVAGGVPLYTDDTRGFDVAVVNSVIPSYGDSRSTEGSSCHACPRPKRTNRSPNRQAVPGG